MTTARRGKVNQVSWRGNITVQQGGSKVLGQKKSNDQWERAMICKDSRTMLTCSWKDGQRLMYVCMYVQQDQGYIHTYHQEEEHCLDLGGAGKAGWGGDGIIWTVLNCIRCWGGGYMALRQTHTKLTPHIWILYVIALPVGGIWRISALINCAQTWNWTSRRQFLCRAEENWQGGWCRCKFVGAVDISIPGKENETDVKEGTAEWTLLVTELKLDYSRSQKSVINYNIW